MSNDGPAILSVARWEDFSGNACWPQVEGGRTQCQRRLPSWRRKQTHGREGTAAGEGQKALVLRTAPQATEPWPRRYGAASPRPHSTNRITAWRWCETNHIVSNQPMGTRSCYSLSLSLACPTHAFLARRVPKYTLIYTVRRIIATQLFLYDRKYQTLKSLNVDY